MNFLASTCYQVFHARSTGWYFLRWENQPNDYAWQFGLTPKKIVYEFFKINGGTLGYYLVNLQQKGFYHCGETLESVKTKLESLNGLRKKVYVSTDRAKIPNIVEELVSPTEEIDDGCLVYEMTHINRFRPYEAAQFTSPTEAKDFAINKRELYQKFLDINGGQLGFYVYKPRTDEVLYFNQICDLKQAISAI